MPFVTVDGIKLEWRLIVGGVDHAPLVFLHEGLGCTALWRDFPDKLARRLQARALVYSRQGYGKSDPIPGPRAPSFLAQEARDVLPKVLAMAGIRRPLIIGHGDGASIALLHAALPDADVAGLVLIAPYVFVEEQMRSHIERLRRRYGRTDLKERLAKYHDHVDDAFLGWAHAWLDPTFRHWSADGQIRSIKAPMLLVQGLKDPFGTVAHIERISALAAGNVERLVLPQAEHAPHYDSEATVIDAVAQFAATHA
jgi:pimeloyl-ACP methyl ester carboxylesterase